MNIKSASALRCVIMPVAALLTVFTFGCAGTRQARHVETSGFLGDYSQLQEGKGDEALLVYVNSKAQFKNYNKILLEPIRVYPGANDSSLQKLSREDRAKLVNYFDATLRKHLSEQFTFVERPGPGVMRFRVALTEAKPSKVALDTMSSVLPPAIVMNALKTVATGSGLAVGSAGVEFEALDAQTGERLAASVDERIGKKYTGKFDKFDEWRAAQDSFDYWADRLNTRLAELRN